MRSIPGISKVVRFRSLGSTQDEAKRLAEAGAPHRTLVWADRQTRGRGREDRRWSSGPGGAFFSIILRPVLSPDALGELSAGVGRALAEALRDLAGVETKVKPPNDVLARRDPSSPWKKAAGILLEARSGGRAVDWLVIGVGINVNNRLPPKLGHASSLKSLTGKALDVRAVVESAVASILSLTRPSDTLSPRSGEREGVRG